MKGRLQFAYQTTSIQGKNVFDLNMKKNPFLTIRGAIPANYKVNFIDKETNTTHYSNDISTGGWVACGLDYYVNW